MQENEKTKNERKWCTVLSNTGAAFPKTGKPANKVKQSDKKEFILESGMRQ
jgi:hypothetical protein